MITRLFVGLFKGALFGAALAAAMYFGLHVTTLATPLAYLAAVLAGTLVGLVAGKPIWAEAAKIEAGLKALFGAGLGALVLFAIRKWVHVPLPATVPGWVDPGGSIALIPAVTTTIAMLFELDNTPAPAKEEAAPKRLRAPKARAADLDDDDDAIEDESASRRGKRG